jgi:nucleoside-diphosphate-sugar epimerase
LTQALVTGAGGFVGKRLVEKLIEEGIKVKAISKSNQKSFHKAVSVIIADLLEPSDYLNEAVKGCELIFHCAGEVNHQPLMRKLHVQGTQNLLDAASRHGTVKHWIQLSSVGVYGRPANKTSYVEEITELTAINPCGEYEITKAESDQIVFEGAIKHGFTYSVLRPSNIVGINMPNQSFRSLINSILKKRFFYIGSRDSISNYVHVDDVIDALMLCAKSPHAKNHIFNLSNDCKLCEIVSCLSNAHGISSSRVILPEALVRFLVKLNPLFIKSPLTQSRIDSLVSNIKYPNTKIEQLLQFTPIRAIPDFSVKLSKSSYET